MALMDFIKKQFIDIIQWTETGDGTLAWRFPMADMEIQNGGSLTVRESQIAVFVNEGQESALLLGSAAVSAKKTPVTVKLDKAAPGSKARILTADGQVLGTHEVSGGSGRGGQPRPAARFALPPGKYRVEVQTSAGEKRDKEITVTDQPLGVSLD